MIASLLGRPCVKGLGTQRFNKAAWSQDFVYDLRPSFNNCEKHKRRWIGLISALLPIPQCAILKCKSYCKFVLCEAKRMAYLSNTYVRSGNRGRPHPEGLELMLNVADIIHTQLKTDALTFCNSAKDRVCLFQRNAVRHKKPRHIDRQANVTDSLECKATWGTGLFSGLSPCLPP